MLAAGHVLEPRPTDAVEDDDENENDVPHESHRRRKAPSTGNWTVYKAVLTMERYACLHNLRGF
jgi:hypothetical protein